MHSEHDTLAARFTEMILKRANHGPLGPDDLDIIFGRGLRLLLARRGVVDIEQISRTVLSQAADVLRLQASPNPAALASYICTAVNELRLPDRSVKTYPRPAVVGAVKDVLAALAEEERDALMKFYCQEQPSTHVCQEAGYTQEFFSALRSRVKGAISHGDVKRAGQSSG
jgi:hypothetical protein